MFGYEDDSPVKTKGTIWKPRLQNSWDKCELYFPHLFEHPNKTLKDICGGFL